MKECALSTCPRATADKYCCYDHQRAAGHNAQRSRHRVINNTVNRR